MFKSVRVVTSMRDASPSSANLHVLSNGARALAIAPEDPLTLYNIACNYALLGKWT